MKIDYLLSVIIIFNINAGGCCSYFRTKTNNPYEWHNQWEKKIKQTNSSKRSISQYQRVVPDRTSKFSYAQSLERKTSGGKSVTPHAKVNAWLNAR